MEDKAINHGGYAFACVSMDGNWQEGMTMRQWYAGMALQGMLAACPAGFTFNPAHPAGDAATRAFAMADAMIAAEATQAKE